MSQYNNGPKTYNANAALVPYRLVKMTAGAVITSGALATNATVDYTSTGDDAIGATLTQTSASGQPVTVAHRDPQGTMKLTAAGAITAGAKVYATGSAGKVAATGTGPAIAIAIEAAGADGDIIECRYINGSAVDGDSAADSASGANSGALPILYALEAVTATAGTYAIATPNRKVRIVNWWVVARDTTASNVKIQNGSTDASANVAKGVTNDAIVQGGTIVAAQATVAAGTAINVVSSGNASFDVYVLCRPTA